MVTTAEQIRNIAIKEVEISGFDGEMISIKLKPISMLKLISSGKIPNQLTGKAIELFEGKQAEIKDDDKKQEKMSEISDMMDIICENSMLEPTFAEVGEILTDIQKMEIFYYAQGGLRALESFRNVTKSTQLAIDSTNIQSDTVKPSKPRR